MSPKHYIKLPLQGLLVLHYTAAIFERDKTLGQATKMNFNNCEANKFPKTISVILFNLLQVCPSVPSFVLGNLSNNDGDGYENVTEKVNSHHLKLHRTYSNSLNSSNVGKFSGVEF